MSTTEGLVEVCGDITQILNRGSFSSTETKREISIALHFQLEETEMVKQWATLGYRGDICFEAQIIRDSYPWKRNPFMVYDLSNIRKQYKSKKVDFTFMEESKTYI
jgi:hypothetical protein